MDKGNNCEHCKKFNICFPNPNYRLCTRDCDGFVRNKSI